MEFKTLTSTLVLSFLLTGSHAIAMEEERTGNESRSLAVHPTANPDVYVLTEDDQRLIGQLNKGQENGPNKEAKEAERRLNAIVVAMLEHKKDVTAYLAAIDVALKKPEIPSTSPSTSEVVIEPKSSPVAQVPAEAPNVTEEDWLTASTLNVDLTQAMANALVEGASEETKAAGVKAAQELKKIALDKKQHKTEETVPAAPLTQEQANAVSWWGKWTAKVTLPEEGETPKVTVTIDDSPSFFSNLNPFNSMFNPFNSIPNPFNWKLWGGDSSAVPDVETDKEVIENAEGTAPVSGDAKNQKELDALSKLADDQMLAL